MHGAIGLWIGRRAGWLSRTAEPERGIHSTQRRSWRLSAACPRDESARAASTHIAASGARIGLPSGSLSMHYRSESGRGWLWNWIGAPEQAEGLPQSRVPKQSSFSATPASLLRGNALEVPPPRPPAGLVRDRPGAGSGFAGRANSRLPELKAPSKPQSDAGGGLGPGQPELAGQCNVRASFSCGWQRRIRLAFPCERPPGGRRWKNITVRCLRCRGLTESCGSTVVSPALPAGIGADGEHSARIGPWSGGPQLRDLG